MVSITKATPKAVFTGFKDDSGRALLPERVQFPQHLPIFYIQGERGRMSPFWASGAELQTMLGTNTFNPRKKWYSHATLGLETCIANGNMALVKRVAEASAEFSTLVLSVEVVAKTLTPYKRMADGTVITNAVTGQPEEDQAATPVSGYLCQWHVSKLDDTSNLAALNPTTPGSLAGDAGEQSTIYPIMAFKVSSKGAFGDNTGIAIHLPHARIHGGAGDIFAMEDMEELIFRAQLFEREDAKSSPVVINTKTTGEKYVDFSLKNGIFNRKTNKTYDPTNLVYAHEIKEAGYMPVDAPFGDVYVYENNLNTVRGLIFAAEEQVNPNIAGEGLVNLFEALDSQGVPHYALRVVNDTGISFGRDSIHYATGGSDGNVDLTTLDTLVRSEVKTNWENPDYPLVDRLRYPISAVYDTGFTLETKKAILSLVGKRPDIYVTACTWDVLTPEPTNSEEISLLTTLRAHARLIPESTINGTPFCRGTIYGQAMTLPNHPLKLRVPCVIEAIHKRSQYMGAGNGILKPTKRYDEYPLNKMELGTDVSNTWVPDILKDSFWENGINRAQYMDANDVGYPAFQTVYSDDTSILNSEITMTIAVDVVKKCEIAWTWLVGNTRLTRAEFISRSNKIIERLTAGRYDGRVTVTPNTYFTPEDDARGYSWTCDATIAGDPMRTVGTYNVITTRRTDASQLAA